MRLRRYNNFRNTQSRTTDFVVRNTWYGKLRANRRHIPECLFRNIKNIFQNQLSGIHSRLGCSFGDYETFCIMWEMDFELLILLSGIPDPGKLQANRRSISECLFQNIKNIFQISGIHSKLSCSFWDYETFCIMWEMDLELLILLSGIPDTKNYKLIKDIFQNICS